MQNLYRIKDKNKRIIKLKFNNAQWKIVRVIQQQKPIRHITIKSRQEGVSTLLLLWHLDDTMFHFNTTTGVLSHKWESLHHLWNIIELAYNYLPADLKPPLGEASKKMLYFKELESRIFISLSIRSTGLNNLHISEWCFCKDDEVKATLGAISNSTNITGESTGNGVGNDGYITYQEAKTGDNEYKHLFLPWFIQEEYKLPLLEQNPKEIMSKLSVEEKRLKDIMNKDYNLQLEPGQVLWRRQTRKRLKDLFPQEFPETDEDAFITSGMHYFNVKKIMALLIEARNYKLSSQFAEESDRYICFESPIPGDIYVAGGDASEGVNDYCALKIINATKRREAFLFHAKCGVKTFYKQTDYWCRKYNNALLAMESNYPGNAILLGLNEDCRYPNLYVQREDTRPLGKIKDKPKIKLGWQTSSVSRKLMLAEFKYFIEDEDDIDVDDFAPEYSIYDEMLLREMLTFINNDGKYEAKEGKHDDIIFASAIATQMYKIMRPKQGRTSAGKGNIGISIGQKYESTQL